MIRILGVDPGSRITGYGLIDCDKSSMKYVASGSIKLRADNLSERLYRIFTDISALIDQHQPQIAAVEKVFVSVNPQSALKIGHARGSAICACASKSLVIEEYAAREIKRSVTGNGAANKDQVKFMVQMLLGLDQVDTQDEADALAVAITHYQFMPLIASIKDSRQRFVPPDAIASVTR